MMNTATLTLAVALIAFAHAASPLVADDKPAPVRVMSFNIRYGTANDGDNHWNKRKDLVIEVIKAYDPDLLGTQETLAFQREYIEKNTEGYEGFGVGRDDGKDKGEQTAMFFRKAHFEKLDGGHFWLSKTPDEPGSKSWDTSLTRMVSWLKLRDKKNKDAPAVIWFNTHFDHRGPEARIESAKLIRQRVTDIAADALVIVTGDFNAAEGSKPYQAMFEPLNEKASPLVDSFRKKHPEKLEEEGSFNSFGPRPGKERIDWIACCRQWTVLDAKIDRWHKDGRWPSDHFPITAELQSR
ncbi:MAG: endonuclease/exonuclease/phosphatase family protein [Phycisphaeraceae bacterium]